MKRTFKSEDVRKEKLFQAWNPLLQDIYLRQIGTRFDEIYEGMTTVLGFSNTNLGIELADGRRLHDLPITHEIRELSHREDMMYFVLGFREGRWLPLELVSVGSVLEVTEQGHTQFHMTVNPIITDLREKASQASQVLQ